MPPKITDLRSVETECGVTEEGTAFCSVRALGEDNITLLGQLSPDILREMAMQFLETAEAAEQDAAVWRVLQKLDLPEGLRGMIIVELQSTRKDQI